MVKIQIHLCFKIIKVKMQDVLLMVHKMNLQFGLLEMEVHIVIFKTKIAQIQELRMFHHLELL